MREVYLCGPAHYLPGEPIDNAAMERLFQLDAEWIDQFVGTESRHLAFDLETWKATENLASLGIKAAQATLARCGLSKDKLDFLLLSTATPDQMMPATVNQIADGLGLNGLATYQIQCGCVGALQAMQLGVLLVRSGAFKTGLVIGADVCAKFIRTREECASLSASELINYALFGDGAGAVVASSAPIGDGYKLEEIVVRFEGLGAAPGQEVNWFGVRQDAPYALREDYKAIQTRVPTMTSQMLDELLVKLDLTLDDIDHFLLPQLSKNMSNLIAKDLGIARERTVQPVDVTGNNGNALPFIQLSMLESRVEPGERAISIAIESSKWLAGGMTLRRL